MSTLRGRLGLTQEEFAQRLGISRNYVSMLEKGREPSESLRLLVERMVREAEGTTVVEDPAPYLADKRIEVNWLPVISWTHAGQAVAYEELPQHWQEKVPAVCASPNAFALIVEGDSMEPRCVSGDKVIVMPEEEPRNGCLVVAKLRDDGIVLRRYTRTPENKVRLTAYNCVYPPMDYQPQDFHWIYPVHSTLRKEWN